MVVIQSFGHARGIPPNSDLVFDVRDLPDPFYVKPELKSASGLDAGVIEFLNSQPDVDQMAQKIYTKIADVMQQNRSSDGNDKDDYERDDYEFVISIGCFGGRFRSVYMAERIGKSLRDSLDIELEVRHVHMSDWEEYFGI